MVYETCTSFDDVLFCSKQQEDLVLVTQSLSPYDCPSKKGRKADSKE